MITAFVRALREAGLDPEPVEVADALWLAAHLDRGVAHSPFDVGPGSRVPNPGAGTPAPVEQPETAPPDPAGEEHDTAELHPLAPDDGTAPLGVPGTTFLTPAAPALTDALALARSLRPLKRRVPSRREREIDEEATVRQVADGGPWEPVMRPTRERWLDIALVVERSESAALWRSTIEEFRRILERLGAFRDVRLWSLRTQPGVGLAVAPDGAQEQARDPRELVDPSGRRLILVVSDFTSDLWFTDEIRNVFFVWSSSGPTGLLSLLPERLFPQTAVGPLIGRARAFAPGSPAVSLRRTRTPPSLRRRQEAALAVPVTAIEPRALAAWASMVGAAGGEDVPAVMLARAVGASGPRNTTDAERDAEEPDGRAAVALFRATASPFAAELASYLAAAPLTLRVMRLVQSAMLPRSSHVHLAEVFLSGLLRRVRSGGPPEDVLYDFVGDVREWLLNDLAVSDALQVLEGVSEFISDQLGTPNQFVSVLRDSGGEGEVRISEAERPFALVAARVLRRLGGRYARIAARLESSDSPAGGALAPASRRALREGADDYAIIFNRKANPFRTPAWKAPLMYEWLVDSDRGRLPPDHVLVTSKEGIGRGEMSQIVREFTRSTMGRRLYLYYIGGVEVHRDGDVALHARGMHGESLTHLLRAIAELQRFDEVVVFLDGDYDGVDPAPAADTIKETLRDDFGIRCLLIAVLTRSTGPADSVSAPQWVMGSLSTHRRVTGREVALNLSLFALKPLSAFVAGNDLEIAFPPALSNSAVVIVTSRDSTVAAVRMMDASTGQQFELELVDGYSAIRLPPGSYNTSVRLANQPGWQGATPNPVVIADTHSAIISVAPWQAYNFSARIRTVLAMAREEAIRLQHDYVGTEHILLGLIREGEGVAAAVLNNLAVDLDQIQEKVEESVRRGKATIALGELPYTSRAKKVLEFAIAESRELGHDHIGTEHLLLGLMREEKGVAAEVLNQLGVLPEDARNETLKLLGP